MPTTNERKHVIPAGGDASFSRATIFEAFGNSIHDVIPVASATERAQVVSNLVAAGAGPTASDPLVVIRGDAPGLHRIEYTYNGTAWLSDVLSFATTADADSFGAANGGVLSKGDEALVGSNKYLWSGTAWVAQDTGWINLTLNSGWTPTLTAEVPKLRVQGGRLQLVGAVSATPSAGAVIGVLAAEHRPTSIGYTSAFTGFSDSHGVVKLLIGDKSGEIVCVQGVGAARSNVSLAQITFPVG